MPHGGYSADPPPSKTFTMVPPPIAFVAGATGYVGRTLVQDLLDRGITTVAHVRPDSPALHDWCATFGAAGARADWTPWELGALTDALRKLRPTHVFAVVGTTRTRIRDDPRGLESYESIDFGLTKLLIDACVAAGCSPRFVYLSAAGTGVDAPGPYLKARWYVEEALSASPLPFTAIRSSWIIGSDRDDPRIWQERAAKVLDGILSAAGAVGGKRLQERYRSTTVDELVDGMVHAAFNYTTICRVLEADEVRYETANDREHHFPDSRRDTDRH